MKHGTVFTALFGFTLLAGCGSAMARNWYVEEAPEWTDVVTRTYGWTGADGIFTVPLDGNEQLGAHHTNHTLVVFSDTFIGEVDNQGNRLNTSMVNNTLAYFPPGAPDPDASLFFFNGTINDPESIFVPDTPHSQQGQWYWPSDGIALDSSVYFIVWRMRSDQQNGFARDGIAMVRLPAGSRPPFDDYEQWELPFHQPATEDRGELSIGVGILPNTVRAHAPHPDGFIYIYGVEEVWLNKFLLVARVPEAQFTNPDAWRFWAGQPNGWSADFHDAVRTAGRVSPEMSVTPLPDGRYIMVFQLDTIGNDVAFRIGPAPWGPWGDYHVIYHCPEPDQYPDLPIWTYNAKAHPHLSEPGTLLISYNVNCNDFWAHFSHADIYHPRFIRLVYTGNRF